MSEANSQGGAPAAGTPGAEAQPGGQPNPNPQGQQPGAQPGAEQQPNQQPGDKSEAGPAPVVYEPTNNVGLDMALEFIGGLGIGPEDAAMKAAETGDFAPLEALLRGMGDRAKGYERMLALGKGAFESFSKEQKAKAEESKKAIYAVVGGEQRWAEVEAWAKSNAEPAEKEAVNAALSAGGLQARSMAFYLNHRFENAAGTTYKPREQVADPAAGSGRGNGGNGPLSPAEYARSVAELRKQLGGKFEGSPQYAQLQQRRRAYRG